jgi:hypothetical protein
VGEVFLVDLTDRIQSIFVIGTLDPYLLPDHATDRDERLESYGTMLAAPPEVPLGRQRLLDQYVMNSHHDLHIQRFQDVS